MTKTKMTLNCSFAMMRVTGIEPVSRAWEPSNGALVYALSCGQERPWLTVIGPGLWHDSGPASCRRASRDQPYRH